jgi:P-type conjugative transfer protein TrbJ
MPVHCHPFRRHPLRHLIGAASLAVVLCGSPAHAQLVTFDPVNLIENALTAARELEQIANQASQIANQVKSLENEAKNLASLGKSFTPDFLGELKAMDGLIDEAAGVALKVQDTRDALQSLYKGDYAGTTIAARAQAAQRQLDNAREALKTSLLLQAQATEQIRADETALQALANASSSAGGALAVAQATNEYLAFTAEQMMRLQQILIATSRAEALEQSRALEARAQAEAEHDHFFGTAESAYPGARPWN